MVITVILSSLNQAWVPWFFDKLEKNDVESIRTGMSTVEEVEYNLINASLVLKQQQIYMQNIVQVLVELIFPFIPKYANVDYYGEVRQLIEIKFEYKLGAKNIKTYSKRNWDKEKFLQFEAIPDIVPIYINGII